MIDLNRTSNKLIFNQRTSTASGSDKLYGESQPF